MSLYSRLTGSGASGFGYGSTAEAVSAGLDLTGRRYVVTGANSGIGLETVRVLGLRGATVLTLARSVEKASEAVKGLKGHFVPVACELSEPASVRAAVASIATGGEALDGVLCNAGIMALPTLEQKYGYELQFFTNHVGHFLLVTGLADVLKPDARVVLVSSAAHKGAPAAGIDFENLSGERGYAPWTAYGQSKLANLLMARELARRWAGTARVANAVHPGVIQTNLLRHMATPLQWVWGLAAPLVLKDIPEGAATQTWALVNTAAGTLTGEYLADCNVAASSALGRDTALAAKLWTETERIVAGL